MKTALRCALTLAALSPVTVRADEPIPIELRAHKADVWCLVFAPDGKPEMRPQIWPLPISLFAWLSFEIATRASRGSRVRGSGN